MKRTIISVALATCVAGAIALGPASGKDANQLTASPDVYKVLQAAEKLINAGDYRTALDTLKGAQALPKRTPEDDYLIQGLLAAAAIRANDMATATTAFESMADSPLIDKDPARVTVLSNAMIVEDSQKKYAKAIAYAQKLQSIQPLDDKQLASLCEAYYFTNDFPHVKQIGAQVLTESKTKGTVPPQGILQMLMNADLNTGDKTGAFEVSEQLAADYNVPSDWARVIHISLETKGAAAYQQIAALDLLRLGVATGAALDTSDYNLMGDISMRSAFYGDAVTAARHGGKAAGASAKAAVDQKELAGLIAAAKNQDAKHNIVLAEDLYGYGRYSEAEQLARNALAKGGFAPEANMLIGMSLAGEGKYADATTSFQQVSGDAAMVKAAQLWTLYAQHKATPPQAATTPAPAAVAGH